MTDTLRVLSAGSLRYAFPAIIDRFAAASGIDVSVAFGPAGLLRERIQSGEAFDLFASANMAHPRALAESGLADHPTCFATNRLCVLTRADLGMSTENFIEVLSDPAVRIGTSTPGDDPSGDYAFEVFDLIDAAHPGLGGELKSRARQLVGGRNSPAPSGGVGAFVAAGEVDLMMYYYSNARLGENDPAFRIVDIPAAFAPRIEYGLALSIAAPGHASLLKEFVLSSAGQNILAEAGFSSPAAHWLGDPREKFTNP